MSSTTFFTSDQHYRHRNIIEHANRPFLSVDEMNETMVNRHNAIVRPGDVVVHVGDFSLDSRAVEPILKRLNGIHLLIAGNHDHCHPCRRKRSRAGRDRYLEWGFRSVATRATFGPFLVCHFPYANPQDPDQRYQEIRPRDEGRPLLHGHVHGAWKSKLTRERATLMVNVGVDVWSFAPVSYEELVAHASGCGCSLKSGLGEQLGT